VIHILLAAYNEAESLGDVIAGVARAFADGDWTAWVVDDGSTDGTPDVAQRHAGPFPVRLLRHGTNRGLGAALRTGFSTIGAVMGPRDVLVTLDADNTHPPAQIPALVAEVEAGRADIAIASRFRPSARVVGVPWHRRMLSRGAEAVFRLFVPVPGVRDYTCGFRAYGASCVRALPAEDLIREDGFAAQAEILIRLTRRGARATEIPLVLRYDRKKGDSKMRIVRTVARTLGVVARLRRL
jgi:dolichol-phosphate mannosyltransferase